MDYVRLSQDIRFDREDTGGGGPGQEILRILTNGYQKNKIIVDQLPYISSFW